MFDRIIKWDGQKHDIISFMSVPILLTKLFIPPARPELVTRSHLTEKLNRNLNRKLTLISAPAGFGKTTLVADWLQSQGNDVSPPFFVGWFSLDEGDNDTVRFLTYLITALNRIQGLETEMGVVALQMLQSPQPPSPETILIAVINEIALVTDKIVLILDDYHLIDSQQIHESLNFLIENLPPQLHLVITTREDPPIQISRLRARGQLNELRALDLRFTGEETAVFLNQVIGLNLSPANIAALETRTEGWITGLQMAAISMKGSKDVEGFIKSFAGSHRFVLDYLLEEVLEQQTEEILFIVPLDNERRWYRYHHLFDDLLQQRLHQKMGHLSTQLHGKASAWYEQNDMVSDAVRHALAAKDMTRVASLAEMNWQVMDNNFQSNTWLDWVKAVPDDLVRSRPVLSTQYAWALWLCGELEASESRLRDAESWLESDGNPIDQFDSSANEMVVVDRKMFRVLPANIAHVRGSNAQARGDLSNAQKYFELALSLIPEDDQIAQAGILVNLGFIYWANGDLARARDAVADWINSLRVAGNIVFAVAGTFALADIMIAQAKLKESRGDLEAALDLLEDAKQLNIRNPLPDLRPIDALQANIYIRQGHLSQAQAWVRAQNLSADDELSYLHEFEHLTLARVLMAEHASDPDKHTILAAIGLLERLIIAAEDGERLASMIDILIVLALAFDLNRDRKSAMAALERALLLAYPEGFVHIFVDEGPPMARLLYDALEKDIAPNYVRKLLAAFPDTEPVQTPPSQSQIAEAEWIEPLSEREIEVLHLIAAGLSRPEIAAKLFLSKNTIKTHARNIFSKLGVNNQMQVVGKARRLGLLEID